MAPKTAAVPRIEETDVQSYLLKRAGVYYARVWVPEDLRLVKGAREVKRSLKTKDRTQAVSRVAAEVAQIRREFDELRAGVTNLNDVITRRIEDITPREREAICADIARNLFWGEQNAKNAGRESWEPPTKGEKAEIAKLRQNLLKIRKAGDLGLMEPAAMSHLPMHGIIVTDKAGAHFTKFLATLLDAYIRAYDGIVAMHHGLEVSDEGLFSTRNEWMPKEFAKLSSLADVALAIASQDDKKLAKKTLDYYNTVAKEFDTWLGRSGLNATTEDIKSFVKSMRERGQSDRTVRNKTSYLKALFAKALELKFLDKNPAESVAMPPKPKTRSRLAYEPGELEVLFHSDIYTKGVRPIGGRGEAAAWIPLIALFTGARLEEIAQLEITDVYRDKYDDCYVFRFWDMGDGQTLKTASSRRLVPVHDELIHAGLVRFVKAQRDAGQKRLFHDLTEDRYGSLGATFSKWWGRHARALGITDKAKVFHSFRHLVIKLLKRHNIDGDVRRALVGHTSRDVHGEYGGEDYPMPPKLDAIRKLRYPGVVIPVICP